MPEYPELPILPSKHEMHLWLTTAFADRLVVTPRVSGARQEMEESQQALEPAAPPVRPGPGAPRSAADSPPADPDRGKESRRSPAAVSKRQPALS
ncbi:hypothetical protein HEP87_53885 [Streptomyces sp. S1D4-11]